MGVLFRFFLKVIAALIITAFIFSFAFNRWIQPDANGNAQEMVSSGSFIDVDNYQYHYLDEGSGVNTFVLLHAYGSSADTWRFMIPALAKTGRVIAPDFLGFGYSQKGKDIDYRVEARVQRLRNLLAALKAKDIVIIADGYGTQVALGYTQTYQSDVRGMVLISPTLFGTAKVPGAFLRVPEISKAAIKLAYSDKRLKAKYKKLYADPSVITPADVLIYGSPYKVQGTEESLIEINALHDNPPYDHAIPHARTVVLYGNKDTRTRRVDADRLAADMFNARFFELDNVGFLAQEEAPEQVLHQVDLLLQQIK